MRRTKTVTTKPKAKPMREWVRLDLRLVHNHKVLATGERLVRRPASERKVEGVITRWVSGQSRLILARMANDSAWHLTDSDNGGTVPLGPVVRYTMTSVYL
jgi:hypothetical protein